MSLVKRRYIVHTLPYRRQDDVKMMSASFLSCAASDGYLEKLGLNSGFPGTLHREDKKKEQPRISCASKLTLTMIRICVPGHHTY
jgi:hypothetical protein